jgi:P4 family phage/plasmid primase-like protien
MSEEEKVMQENSLAYIEIKKLINMFGKIPSRQEIVDHLIVKSRTLLQEYISADDEYKKEMFKNNSDIFENESKKIENINVWELDFLITKAELQINELNRIKVEEKKIKLRKDSEEKKERIKLEVVGLINDKPKQWGAGTEILVDYIKDKKNIYTTKEDEKSEVWIYNNGVYVPNGKSEIKEILRDLLGSWYSQYIYGLVLAKIEPDTYIDSKEFFGYNYKEEIPVQNGILNIYTRELKEFTPDKIFFNKLPLEYNKEAKCTKIDEFLKSIFPCEEDKKVFYELGGFCLLKEYTFEKAFMFVGNGRNGKDKSLELIKRCIGIENCCAVPLVSLDPSSFVISELFGKMANLAGEISNHDLKDTSMFKALTGRSLISAKRKFLNDIRFVNYSKFVFACNELPMVYDMSRGFWDRWVLLEFPYTFVSQEEIDQNPNNKYLRLRDENIIEKITTDEELSGLLNKFLDGLSDLTSKGKFSLTKGTEEIKNFWIKKSNSFISFCLDHIEEDYSGSISKGMLRKLYSDYCKQNKIPVKSEFVVKKVLQEQYGVSEERQFDSLLNKQIYSWIGIKLKQKGGNN